MATNQVGAAWMVSREQDRRGNAIGKLLERVEMVTEPGSMVVRSYHLDYALSEATDRPLL